MAEADSKEMADTETLSHSRAVPLTNEEDFTEVVKTDNSGNTHIYAIFSEIVTLRVCG